MPDVQLEAPLTGKKLPISVRGMDDQKAWFSEAARRRVTVTEIADHLGVSRKTGQTRLESGLSADDIVVLARALNLNPVAALTELGKLTYDEVHGYLESGGKLLETATEGELALELAQRLNTVRDAQNWWANRELPQAERAKPKPDRPADDSGKVHNLRSTKKVLNLDGVRHAASRREKEMYQETPDEGV